MNTIFRKIVLGCTLLLCLTASGVAAQHALFLTQGNISYEKSVNVLAVMKEQQDDNIWQQKAVEAYENSGRSPFVVSNFNMAFNGNKTLYTPLDEEQKSTSFGLAQSAADNNIVYTDLDSQRRTVSKTVFDDNFLLQDSTRQIHWKITDETREIAGFQCRRANALIMDSIYVVAFYTNDIVTPGGPESFSGLPGMILQVALPHLHMTWMAKKISVDPPVSASVTVPPTARRKAIAVTQKELYDLLNKRLKEWGKEGQSIMLNSLL